MTSYDDFDEEFRREFGREFGHARDGRGDADWHGDVDPERSSRIDDASLMISIIGIMVTLAGPLSGLVTLSGLFIPVGVAGMVAMILAAVTRQWVLVGLGAITAVFPLVALLVISEVFGAA